jgi:uncharacterized protein YcbK (DUF882 family)
MRYAAHTMFLAGSVIVWVSLFFSPAANPGDSSRFASSTVEVIPETAVEKDTETDSACTSVYEHEREPAFLQTSSLVRPAKIAKRFKPAWRPSRRRGLRRAVTTFYSVHSDEAVPVLEAKLPPLEVFDELFRCRGFGTKQRVDPLLVETAIAAARHFKSDRIEVISGYRSPKFNDALAKKGRHVATESKHTKGQALDIRIVGTDAVTVGKWLFDNFEGGVGTYHVNDFVHIDVGPKRRWRGR